MIVCRMSCNWDLSDVFLMIGFGFMGFGEEDHRIKCHFITSQQGYTLST